MPQQHASGLHSVIEWVVTFVAVFAFFLLIRFFVIEPYVVPTGSMESTILVGDQLLGEKVTIELGMDVKQGDIVVFDNPDDSSSSDILVKRVIATGGQTIDLVDGAVTVDGVELDEPYTQGESWPLAQQANGVQISYPYTVPEGSVWVMGDNRENSADSRYFGPVARENLIAVAVFRYWPLSRIGTL